MFNCISCNKSFDSRSGLGNHKHCWSCTDSTNNSDANVSFFQYNTAIETNPNSNSASSFVAVNNNIVNDGNRTCKRNRNYAEDEEIDTESDMANEIAHNKSFAMIYNAMMENHESYAVADRYDNGLDSDNEDFVDNDNEDMDNISEATMEEQSMNNRNTDEILEDTILDCISSNSLMLLQKTPETTNRSKLSTNVIAAIELMAIL